MATSGSFNSNAAGSGGNYPNTQTFAWSLNSQNVGSNQSTIAFDYYVNGNGSYWNNWWNQQMVIDGTAVYTYSGQHKVYGGTHFSNSYWTMGHDGAGNKSFGASVQAGIETVAVNSTGSGSWGLPQIPRHANITNFSGNQNDEFVNPWVEFSNPAGVAVNAYFDLPSLGVGGIANRNNVGSRHTWTLTDAERDQIRTAMANVNSTTLRYVIHDTGGGSDNWSYWDATISIVNGNPTFTDFDFKDTNATITAITGDDSKIVQGQSTLRAYVTAAKKMTANKKSTAVNYNANINGVSKTGAYSAGAEVDMDYAASDINVATNPLTLTVSAYDSRGNFTSVQKSVTIIPYAAPVVNATLSRENQFDDPVTLHIGGSISPLTVSGVDKNAIHSVGTTTANKVEYRISIDGAAYGAWTDVTAAVAAGTGALTVADFTPTGASGDTSTHYYDVQVRVTDKITTTTTTLHLDSGIADMRIGTDGRIYNSEQPLRRFDVGDIYLTADSTMNTASAVAARYGGTWIAASVGQSLVGYDSSQTEFNALGKTGGEKTHVLTVAEMPKHNHSIGGSGGANNGVNDTSSATYNTAWGGGGGVSIINQSASASMLTGKYVNDAGSGGAHNNMHPYEVVYAWKRTA